MSSREDFVKKLKKGLATGAVVLSGTTLIMGCESRDVKSVMQSTETQSQESFNDLSEQEKENIKEVIIEKEEFLNKILEEYKKSHPTREINKENIGIIKDTSLFAWKNNEKYYIDQESNFYKKYQNIDRDKKDYDLMIIDKKNNKILFVISKINGEIQETYMYGYYDEKNNKRYMNDRSYSSVISTDYNKDECFKGAKSFLKYRTNSKYKKWEPYIELQEKNVIIEEVERPGVHNDDIER